MTSALKGSRESLNRIEVSKFDWYYSADKAELYHYDKGVYKLYAAYLPQVGIKPTSPTKFFTHHNLKVLLEEAVYAEVWIDNDYIYLVKVL